MPTYYRLTLIFVLFCLLLSLTFSFPLSLSRPACLPVLVTSFGCLPWLALLSLSLNGAKWKVKDKFRVHFVRRKRLIWQCVWLRRKHKKKEAERESRYQLRRTAGAFRRGNNHSPQLLPTLLPPPSQLSSGLAFRRVRSNLSLAFCCCCCCGYTASLSLPLFSLLFSLFLCSLNIPASLVFLGFVFLLILLLGKLCESRIFV